MQRTQQTLNDVIERLAKNFCFMLTVIFMLFGLCVFAQSAVAQKQEIKPQLFGAGVLSVGEVYRGCFAPDGYTFYFFKKVTPDREDYRIFVSKRLNGKWSEPERVNLGGEYSDLYPAISKDGKRLVFASYRRAPGDTSAKANAHLWYVDRKGSEWGEPVFMTAANQLGHYHSWVEFGWDGGVYYRRTTPDWQSTQTLISYWKAGEFTAPVVFEAAERWKGWRADLRIAGGSPSPDGRAIFLDVATRNPKTGRGASDIWVSVKQGKTWTEPKPLAGDINSDGYDVFPFFSPDGKELYFVRDFAAFYHLSLKTALNTVR